MGRGGVCVCKRGGGGGVTSQCMFRASGNISKLIKIFIPRLKFKLLIGSMYRIYHVYEEYKRRYTPLDGLPEAIAEGKQPSGVYRVYTSSRRGISGLYNI